MSLSIKGVVLPGDHLIEWRPNEEVATEVRARLQATVDDEQLDDSDSRSFLGAAWGALDYVCNRGEHPGRSWEGAHVTWHLLQIAGRQVHSNAFNPIASRGVDALNDAMQQAGCPVGLFDTTPRFGPWGVADVDATFFGGWDRGTQRSVAAAIRSVGTGDTPTLLSELGRWVDTAIERDLTLWAWIA